MQKIRNWSALILVFVLAGACLAQEAAPSKFYKLEFVVKEVEGTKVQNARSYSVTVSVDKGCSIRTGGTVPTPTAAMGSLPQFSYHDVGVNVDCHHVREAANGLSLDVNADITSVLQEPTTPPTIPPPPVIRHNQWSSTVIVPLKKPTVIFSSDDLTTKHQMQLELTATPII